ncbi:MAG: hypothetical protein HYV26_01670 [Candidatus Hydrogenedentes bacterium]|nr:hypothetical protein [Candidatus Hydrogenedentota bacterium]
MDLSSVRELKAALATQVAPVASEAVRMRGAARPLRLGAAPTAALALGVAPKPEGGFALAVRIQHRVLESSRTVDLITRQAKGEVDVRYIGRVAKRATPWYQQRQRPLLIGCSVGHVNITAGTLGAFVQRRGGGPLSILSNNHVLADENRGKVGDAILQQAVDDGGQDPNDLVATLAGVVKLKRSGSNLTDCAIAEIVEGIEAHPAKLQGLGKLKGVSDVVMDEGLRVAKIGRTTGLTRGRVTAFELDDVTVEYDLGVVRFDDQIEIEGAGAKPFSDGGDSGSLIVGQDNRAVALLFAGSDHGGANGQGLTYANPIRAVLDALKVDLVF